MLRFLRRGRLHVFDREGGQITCAGTGQDGGFQAGVAIPPTAQRFKNNGDGTVTDKLTGLMWIIDASLYEIGWLNALSACNSCSVGNHDDWRLPNVRELQSLIDYGKHSPALPDDHPFANVQFQEGDYWSSTTAYWDLNADAFKVNMDDGRVLIGNKGSDGYVLCVRGGL